MKEVSLIYSGVPTSGNDVTLKGASAGTESYGETSSGSANYSRERRNQSLRFTEVIQMLDRLKSDGSIEDWEIIHHPRPKIEVGGLPVWHFPPKLNDMKKTPGFCYLDRKEERLRSALVCRINYEGRIVYRLDVEVGQKESGYKALVFTAPPARETKTILLVLEVAARVRAIWPGAEELAATTGVIRAESWKRSYVGKMGQQQRGRLNEARALDVIALSANHTSGSATESASSARSAQSKY